MALPLLFLLLLLLSPAPSLGQQQRQQQRQRLSSREDLAALYALRASLTLRARDWPRKADPCTSWRGVRCVAGRVVSLDISNFRRTRLGRRNPRLALDPLSNLTLLESFNSSGFTLTGSIPDHLAPSLLSPLSLLDLSLSNISGPIPTSLSSLPNLTSLRLSSNSLSGPIPASLWSSRDLRFLDVSHNNLTGVLGDAFSNSAAAAAAAAADAVFNLSNNGFYGRLPSGSGRSLGRFRVLDVSGNFLEGDPPRLDDGALVVFAGNNCFRSNGESRQRSVDECASFYARKGLVFDGSGGGKSSGSSSSRRGRLAYILPGAFGGLVVLVAIAAVLAVSLRSRRRRPATGSRRREGASVNAGGSRKAGETNPSGPSAAGDSFTYAQLLEATANFGEANLVRRGRSGDLFRGTLESGALVVVKRIKTEACLVELDLFSHASHARLVPFLGHCLENEKEKLVVYKYMPNRDLSNALYRRRGEGDDSVVKSLDWITRLKIATGVAEALCYLHHEHVPALVHRDIQASSILLDDKFEVRLGSLSNVCPQGDGHHNVITRFLRSSQSAEPSMSGSTSATCTYDVYCLGKVLLELVTGKLGISGWNDANTNEWLDQTLPYVNLYDKELVMKIVDPSLILDEDFMEEVWAVAIVAKSCLNPRPTKRPLMKYILKALENPLRVVRDESLSHSARLRATSSRGSWNAAIFGSWRSSSDVISVSALPREVPSFKRNGAIDSPRNGGEQSFSIWRPSNEIFPEPASMLHEEEV